MAVTKRCRVYIASHRDYEVEKTMTHMMNLGDFKGRSGHGDAMNANERIAAVQYVDGKWYVFTEEITMRQGL